MSDGTRLAEPRIPTSLRAFYGLVRPFKGRDGGDVREFAPYQVDVWNDRFRDQSSRYYIKGPGVGITKLLLLEALNVVLASESQADALVLVADRFEAQRRRDELLAIMDGREASKYLIPRRECTDRMRTPAARAGTGIVVRSPADRADEQARGITFQSVAGIGLSPTDVDHALVLDVMESSYPSDVIKWGMANARAALELRGGKMVVAMTPRAPFYGLSERIPGINDIEPGELCHVGNEVVRRIPVSIAIDAGIIGGGEGCRAEMRLLDRPVRDATYPDSARGH